MGDLFNEFNKYLKMKIKEKNIILIDNLPELCRESINFGNSNTSKVIRSVEDKGYVERNLGDSDKRQMYFSLTAEGKKILKEMELSLIHIF